MVKAICINDKDKPEEIPDSCWVKEGQVYHITWVYKLPIQGFILACDLKEISLYEVDTIYNHYKLDRFALTEEDFYKLLELMKECSDISKEVNIEEILRENTELVPLEREEDLLNL